MTIFVLMFMTVAANGDAKFEQKMTYTIQSACQIVAAAANTDFAATGRSASTIAVCVERKAQ